MILFAATFGENRGAIHAHDGMITCLDATENKLASGGLDKVVAIWDLRAISSNNGFTHAIRKYKLDDTALLKVAIGPDSDYAATSTLKGLYLLDLITGTFRQADTSGGNNTGAPSNTGRYHDLKWIPSKVLYAVGDDSKLNGFVVK